MNWKSTLKLMLLLGFVCITSNAHAVDPPFPWAKAHDTNPTMTTSEIRQDRNDTIGGENVHTLQISNNAKDLKGDTSKLGYSSPVANETKEFSTELDLTGEDAHSLRLTVLADDVAVIKIYAYDESATGHKGDQLHTFSVSGGALWNPASYKEDSYILPSGHKYVIDLHYKNNVHWTDGDQVDVDGVSLYKLETGEVSLDIVTDYAPKGSKSDAVRMDIVVSEIGKIKVKPSHSGDNTGRITIWNDSKTEKLSEDEAEFEMVVAGTEFSVSFWVQGVATSSAVSDVTVTVKLYDADNNLQDTDSDTVTVVEVEVVHPVSSDFETGKAGRIMISTNHDNAYYTTVKTTKAGEVSQTDDTQATITAYVTPKIAGVPVYFRVEDPDPDDPSAYEPDTTKGDNKDTTSPPANKAGSLSASSATTTLVTINGTQRAAAEVVLTITDRNAGDNYKVEASTGSTFTEKQETATLTAWKRLYVEQDKMMRSDKTSKCVKKTPLNDVVASGSEAYVSLTDGSKFAASGWGHVFDNGSAATQAGEVRQIDRIDTDPVPNVIYLKTALNNTYKYSKYAHLGPVVVAGGTVNEAASYFCVDTGLLSQAFAPAFVEFFFPSNNGSGVIPWIEKTSSLEAVLAALSQKWFLNKENREDDEGDNPPPSRAVSDTGKANYFHLIGVGDRDATGTTMGESSWTQNFVFLYIKHIEDHYGANAAKALREATVHEMGHQFQIYAGDPQVHCSNDAYTPPSDNEKCIMNYSNIWTNDKARFCKDHISDGMTNQPSIRDIPDNR